MDLATLGYLLTLSNLGILGGNKLQVKDISIIVDKVSTLKEQLLRYPAYTIEDFRNKSYCRKGYTGMFLSEPLRNFLLKKNLNSKAEGMIFIIHFEDRTVPLEFAKKVKSEDVHLILVDNKTTDVPKTIIEFIDSIHS